MRQPHSSSPAPVPTDKDSLLVIGSLNMDITVSVDALPKAGATLLGKKYETSPGGKGANQAVAAARLGARTWMLGRVGRDPYGKALRSSLLENGVNVDALQEEGDSPTGLALITVERSGQNTIVVVSGANWQLTPSDVTSARPLIERAGMILLQQEVPAETVEAAIATATSAGTPVLLNPAPARPIPTETLRGVSYLIPNETEALALAGMSNETLDSETVVVAAHRLHERGVAHVVVTLGERGAYGLIDGEEHWVPAFTVQAVDTTAAGDAFVAALATRLVEGVPPVKALRFATAAGALAASRPGAQKSLPDRSDVEHFVAENT